MRLRLPRATLLFLMPLVGCADVLGPRPGPEPDPMTVQLDARVVDAYTDFGFELFRRLHADAPESNLTISPTSAAFALAMTYNGAAGETRDAMARVLGVEALPLDELNQANADWLATLRSTGDPAVELSLANSLWALEGYPFLADFMQRNRSYYDAEVTELPFDQEAVRRINRWAEVNTQGRIETILQEIPGDAVLYLLNALYFDAQWTHRFEVSRTLDEAFHRLDGTSVSVPLMRQTLTAPYYSGDGFEMVSLPYGNGRFSMVLALPSMDLALGTLYDRLSAKSWEGWMAEMRSTNVHVMLPRFRMEWEDSLNQTLTAMGMGVAFSGRADFSGMTPGGGLFISLVKQRTSVEVDEAGTVAAAVTLVEMSRVSSGMPALRFDRPFFFAIRDNLTGTLLFLGSVADPVG